MILDNIPLAKILAEHLDEMLVDNGLEKPRQHVIEWDNPITKKMGLLVTKRVAPRVKLQFELINHDPLESFFIVTYKNCSCQFKMTDCSMLTDKNENNPIVKIKTFIKQMWRNYQHVFFELLDEMYITKNEKINQIIQSQNQYKPR
ncbi:MAG: hypothetical protein IJL05_00795 [Alphaproteobacteria bacterium]|nr:hypothetical protein [Alphaproteobacteria bacterium]